MFPATAYRRPAWLLILLICFSGFALPPANAEAATKKTETKRTIAKPVSAKAIPGPTRTKPSKARGKGKSRIVRSASSGGDVQSDRYSELVVDAENGRVLHQVNADARRYPASLTKMMTLYLTFDALKKRKLSLDQRLPVSSKAANQPETNIDLSTGDGISVRDCITSIVVRSANDSAMVLAEAVGKTEWNFAQLMTAKARQLGMKNTIFRNPNGLPDAGQITTARDMAKLGIALRRDFPAYYPYFKVQNFTYEGRDYTGHNRVIGRFPGVDGIKTGYINASGFNLVTSVKRGGRSIVAVILGGSSGAARDNQMVALLERTFAGLYREDKVAEVKIAEAVQEEESAPVLSDNTTLVRGDLQAVEQEQVASILSGHAPNATTADDETAEETEPPASSAGMLRPPPAKSNAVATAGATGGEWGVQVGAYAAATEAQQASAHARRLAVAELADATAEANENPASGIYRARLASLSEAQAKAACRKLIAAKSSCFVYRTAGAN